MTTLATHNGNSQSLLHAPTLGEFHDDMQSVDEAFAQEREDVLAAAAVLTNVLSNCILDLMHEEEKFEAEHSVQIHLPHLDGMDFVVKLAELTAAREIFVAKNSKRHADIANAKKGIEEFTRMRLDAIRVRQDASNPGLAMPELIRY
jgi:hypothetical protein